MGHSGYCIVAAASSTRIRVRSTGMGDSILNQTYFWAGKSPGLAKSRLVSYCAFSIAWIKASKKHSKVQHNVDHRNTFGACSCGRILLRFTTWSNPPAGFASQARLHRLCARRSAWGRYHGNAGRPRWEDKQMRSRSRAADVFAAVTLSPFWSDFSNRNVSTKASNIGCTVSWRSLRDFHGLFLG